MGRVDPGPRPGRSDGAPPPLQTVGMHGLILHLGLANGLVRICDLVCSRTVFLTTAGGNVLLSFS